MIEKIKELVTKLDGKLYWSFKSVERKIILLRGYFFPSTVDDILNKASRELGKLVRKKNKEANAHYAQAMLSHLNALEATDEMKKVYSIFLKFNDRG